MQSPRSVLFACASFPPAPTIPLPARPVSQSVTPKYAKPISCQKKFRYCTGVEEALKMNNRRTLNHTPSPAKTSILPRWA